MDSGGNDREMQIHDNAVILLKPHNCKLGIMLKHLLRGSTQSTEHGPRALGRSLTLCPNRFPKIVRASPASAVPLPASPCSPIPPISYDAPRCARTPGPRGRCQRCGRDDCRGAHATVPGGGWLSGQHGTGAYVYSANVGRNSCVLCGYSLFEQGAFEDPCKVKSAYLSLLQRQISRCVPHRGAYAPQSSPSPARPTGRESARPPAQQAAGPAAPTLRR